MDAKLELDSTTRANPFATYVPICDGVISIINRGSDFKSLTLTVLKKSTAYMGVHWQKGRDGDTVFMQRHPLCNMEEHGRRNLSKYQLHRWDQQSPDASILGRRPVERK
ncbi:hypothetical protein Pmar_PMAR010895 [Perkinsus marinus ATCC 50983]|uniref:Uncharacterized protein n=1 Tax=Perkinsus marinus (strain ATCC 50983 / TXsc) TaxID=423536 RepID=C5LU99_PERM5|nr:hypothetical protein Pmar_PMAR010895 [Perkinsus marinus ATCC 50983]EEQ99632.1 hypothetical protein Pmar_PMAR010895 [Perkinsus marinus ATCC 50983]|eukprot:XP_002766915.1 hypothetical protein Pmar_PMAR010895 [Perkinsus marinus ATCC 50983]